MANPSPESSGARDLKEKSSERIGQAIRGKYVITKLLGVGGMAAVYEANHRNGSRVALKILHTEFARDEAVKGRFLREGYVANKVDHPGRVAILDDDQTEHGEPFLVMELLEGLTLQQLWKKHQRKVPVDKALQISEQVLDTLVPFHEAKIVHRDLKPANIFVTYENVVKLLDFGVAQLRETGEAMTKAGTALGTPSYMSPEQAMGKTDQLDGRSDIFAVGATLYAILSGKRLHHGKSDNEAFILAATQPAPSLARAAPELPVEVIALVDKALQWDRRNRFQNAAAMRDQCRHVLEVLGGAAETAPTTPAPVPPAPASASLRGQQAAVGFGTPQGVGLEGVPPPPLSQDRPRGPAPFATPLPGGAGSFPTPAAPISHGALTPAAPEPLSSQSGAHSSPATQVDPVPASAWGQQQPVWRDDVALDDDRPESERGRPSETGASDAGALTDREGDRADAPRVELPVQELFERFEKALPTLRQYGIDHPEAITRVRGFYRSVNDALRASPDGVFWEIHPFCFSQGDVPVWEPSPPHDIIPYNLCSGGVEEVRIQPGVTEPEVQRLVRAMLLDPRGVGEVDIAGALWESRFTFVKFKLRDDLTEADASEQDRFLKEAGKLEEMAREDLAEVAAMAVSADQSAWQAAHAASAALDLDPAELQALGSQLTTEPDPWRQRYVDAAAEGFVDAAFRRDEQIMLQPLMRYVEQCMYRERYDQLFEVYSGLAERVARLPDKLFWKKEIGVLTSGMFSTEVLRLLLYQSASSQIPGIQRDRLVIGLRQVWKLMDPARLDDGLVLANSLGKGDAFDMVIEFVEASIPGQEDVVVARMDALNPPLAQRMLAAVTSSRTPQALAMLRPLLDSSNPALRCEAMALLSKSPQELGAELMKTLASADPAERSSALTTMLRHKVRLVGPDLVRWIESEQFGKLSAAEQQVAYETLYGLNPARAESLLSAIIEHHGLMADEELDRMRGLAAKVLGDNADNDAPLKVLEGAAKRRPWNTPKLRLCAGAAAEAILNRLSQRAAAGGEPR